MTEMARQRTKAGSAFGERLLGAIRNAGLSMYALEQAAGLSDGYVGRLVRGARTMPRAATLDAIADALGVRREWLRTGEGAMAGTDPPRRTSAPRDPLTAAVAYLGGRVPPDAAAEVASWHNEHPEVDATPDEWADVVRGVGLAMLRRRRWTIGVGQSGRVEVTIYPPSETVHDLTSDGAA